MINKRFDQNNFNHNDLIARIKIKDWTKSRFNVILEDNTDPYGPDLVIKDSGNIKGYIEVEIKRVWVTDKFQYPTVQWPVRKEKFCDYPNIFFFMLNSRMSSLLWTTGSHLKSSPKVLVPNREVASGEYFFQVPLSKVKQSFLEVK